MYCILVLGVVFAVMADSLGDFGSPVGAKGFGFVGVDSVGSVSGSGTPVGFERKSASPAGAGAAVISGEHKPTGSKGLTIHLVDKFEELDLMVKHMNEEYASVIEITGLAEVDINALTYGKSKMVVDVNAVLLNTDEHKRRCTEDCAKRHGAAKIVGGISYTETEANNIEKLEALRLKGTHIIFVSDDDERMRAVIEARLKAFGYCAPVVWCSGGVAMGPYVKEQLPNIRSGLVYVLGVDLEIIKSFVGVKAYMIERVVLMKYSIDGL